MLVRVHLVLGLVVALPLLAWASSGLLYALPAPATGGDRYEKIDPSRIRITPADAIARTGAPVSSLMLEQKNGRVVYSAVAGLRALTIDAETGVVADAAPPSARSHFFRQAHFWFFTGVARVPLLVGSTAASLLLVVTGLAMAWRRLRG